ncbi:hypothetical protein [Anaerosalibacter massiliensis]|uniref:Uncharacterized protein n=1 Tax=Anaerosalibacter massiliensis TaxID=1347392 RepID=A0A9X2S6L8_9FIRM|nr:hypothetical protein [Anaerosalibacter massiliensis]MCR2045509.1 hypothetical protein [Anaerosalibacter massiliensis]
MQNKQLELLKKNYNNALIRFNNMEKWCQTASLEEQLKYENEILKVINKCSELFEEVENSEM